eukprot:2347933-Amphidinium_carterae.1
MLTYVILHGETVSPGLDTGSSCRDVDHCTTYFGAVPLPNGLMKSELSHEMSLKHMPMDDLWTIR